MLTPFHCDLPAQDESYQLQYGDQRKNNNRDNGEGLLHFVSSKRDCKSYTFSVVKRERLSGRATALRVLFVRWLARRWSSNPGLHSEY
jgi:hypothetical protein